MPTGFRRAEAQGLVVWTGDPDDDAVHHSICEWLHELYPVYPAGVRADGTGIRGNLGECMSLRVGLLHDFGDAAYWHYAPTAIAPLKTYPDRGIDIIWLYFGEYEEDDHIVLQEVKTSTQSDLSYANELIRDYDKLFGTDQQFTLATRLQDIWRILRLEHR